MKVAVVMGGPGPERDVSPASGKGILKAVELLGHMAIPLVIDAEGNWLDGQHEAIELLQACDVTIPALHGEGGRLQGFLEQLHIPYVGSGIAASAVGLDRHLTKAVLKAHGIPVTPGVTLRGTELTDTEATLQKLKAAGLDFPLFVKPAAGGSSSGVTRATNLPTLLAAIAEATAFGPRVLVEREMEGREIDLAVLEFPDGRVETAPALEIHADPEQPFFDSTAKHNSNGPRSVAPARIDPELAVRLRRTAIDVFEALGCAGMAQVDFFVPRDGEPVVKEINTFPNFTPASQFPRMWAAAGMSYTDLVNTLIRTAMGRTA
ncbi:D-alanine-D-alanine ligase [Kribbella sp. VKM Ac-2571]|uniref:D-alanine--D-alanine ligase family protein n=1 Tax=Kribbella sp. VKM Ac-2571 TaxID=2512222 RepID=UPI0010E920B9|nr:D-alanine--D-alanine ligase family protein [Kribbella sp. VKM Ac-2571]TDO57406.1 D-alanine-D-alanine ligase [Kribbella sp. VKM Ac-2571]